jgi:hypothetical protein
MPYPRMKVPVTVARIDEIRARLEAAKWLNPPEQNVEMEGHRSCRHVRIDLGEDEYCVDVNEESTGEFIVHAKSDIEYLLKHIDMLEDSVVVYRLGAMEKDTTLDVVSYGEGTGTSRLDWFGKKDVINDSE